LKGLSYAIGSILKEAGGAANAFRIEGTAFSDITARGIKLSPKTRMAD
jgi:hypothetical protein